MKLPRLKSRTALTNLVAATVLMTRAISISAEFSVTAASLDSGGGRSAGSVHSLLGSLGPLQAGAQSSESFQLQGGYFGAVAVVPTAGAPTLRIQPTPREVILAWPATDRGFVLEETTTLTPPTWTPVSATATAVIVGPEYQVRLPWQPGERYFRLRKP